MTEGEDQDWASAMEALVLDRALELAATRPWNSALVQAALEACDLSSADGVLLLPDGPADLAAILFRRHDAAALCELSSIEASALKVRDRIATAVRVRIRAALVDEGAVRKVSAFLSHPRYAPLALRLGWGAADKLWRWAGDTATDENHYSKRVILGLLLISTLKVWADRGQAEGEVYLQARIGNVMAFEKWKAGFPQFGTGIAAAASALGRMRYGFGVRP